MGCGYIATKNALQALNSLYIAVAVLLIVLGGWANQAAVVSSPTVAGGVIAVGVFLLLVAVLGLIGAARHHQVMLFFYMIILFLVFLVQFFVAVACLAVNEEQVQNLVSVGWQDSSNSTQTDAMRTFGCCGLKKQSEHMNCSELDWCSEPKGCDPCFDLITSKLNDSLQTIGAIGLLFSFTEIIGIWLAMRFRNQKNPLESPNMYM